MSVRERLDRYWFEPARLRDLAYLRIGTVLVLLVGQIWPGSLAQQLQLASLPSEWFVPIPALKVLLLPLGWGARPGATLLVIAWIVCCVAGLGALVGAYTRVSLALFALASTFLIVHVYSYGTLHHPQAAATIILWVLLLTPCGAELSVDAMRARVAESRREERFIPRGTDAVSRDARWPLRLTQWMLVLIYLSAGLSKVVMGRSAWLNGHTMSFYLLADGIAHDLPLSVAIAHFRWIGVSSAVVALAFELTFIVCVLVPRTTPVYLATGVGLHTAIYVLMQAPFFQFIALYAAFAEPLREERRRWARRDEGRVWTVVYDGYCPLCIRTATQLDELDGARRLRYVDLERESATALGLLPGMTLDDMREEMAVVTPEGRGLRGFFAVRELSRRIPMLWPLVPVMYAPGVSRIGTRVYAWVAANRARRLCEGDRCGVHGAENGAAKVGAVIDFEGSAS